MCKRRYECFFKKIFDANLVCTTDRKIIEQSSQKTNDHAIFDPIGNPVWLWNIHYDQFTNGVSYFRWSKLVRFLAYTVAVHLRAAIIRWVKSFNLLSNSLWEKCKFGFKSLKVHSYGKSMYSKKKNFISLWIEIMARWKSWA